MPKSNRPVVIASLLGLMLIGLSLFQNCAEPLTEEDLSLSSQSDEGGAFAYKTEFDTLSYMSCTDLKDDESNGIFTIRLGAYDFGGVSLQPEFLKSIEKMDYEKAYDFIKASKLQKDAQLQLSIRSLATALQEPGGQIADGPISFGGNSTPREKFEIDNMFRPLDTPEVFSVLKLLDGKRLRYAQGLAGTDNKRIDGRLRYSQDSILSEEIRKMLQGNGEKKGSLVASYTDISEGNSNLKRSNPEELRRAIGRDFRLSFKSRHANTPIDNVLASVVETNLNTGKVDADQVAWSCPSNLRLKIVRLKTDEFGRSDVGSGCGVYSDKEPNNASDLLPIFRRVLDHEHWYLDIQQGCAIPKTNATKCYGGKYLADDAKISYDTQAECSNEDNTKLCPHYVSICYKVKPE